MGEVASRKKRQSVSKSELEQAEETALRILVPEDGQPRLARLLKDSPEDGLVGNHPSPIVGMALAMRSLGAKDIGFLDGILDQIKQLSCPRGYLDMDKVNFIASIINDLRPKDHLEAIIALQFGNLQLRITNLTARLDQAETVHETEIIGRMLNQYLRTFATFATTLKTYRSSGEQKVTVQHVAVGDGGQAIVGNVTTNAADEKRRVRSKAVIRRERAQTKLELTRCTASGDFQKQERK